MNYLRSNANYYVDKDKQTKVAYDTKGTTKTAFAPSELITREQMAKIIYDFMLYRNVADNGNWNTLNIPDKAKVGSWAQKAVAICYENEIIVGFETGNFAPKEPMNRAQGAAVLNCIVTQLEG